MLVISITIPAKTFVFHSISKTHTHRLYVSLCRWLDRPVSLVPARPLGYRDKTVAGGHGSSCVRVCVCAGVLRWLSFHIRGFGFFVIPVIFLPFCLVRTFSLSVDKINLTKNKSVLFFHQIVFAQSMLEKKHNRFVPLYLQAWCEAELHCLGFDVNCKRLVALVLAGGVIGIRLKSLMGVGRCTQTVAWRNERESSGHVY